MHALNNLSVKLEHTGDLLPAIVPHSFRRQLYALHRTLNEGQTAESRDGVSFCRPCQLTANLITRSPSARQISLGSPIGDLGTAYDLYHAVGL